MALMKPFLTFAVMCFLAAAPALRAQTELPEDQYFNIYSLILKGDRLVEKGKTASAATNYLEAQKELKQFQEDFPLWNTPVVKYRLGYLESKLSPPEATPAAPARTRSKPADSEGAAKPADAGEPVTLMLKWQSGKRYLQSMDMTMDSDINVPGQKNSMKSTIKMGEDYTFSVLKDRDGGGKEVEMEITGISMNMGVGGKSMMSYDSKNPTGGDGGAANPVAAIFQKMVGAHLKLLTDDKGKIQDVEGFDEFANSIATAGGAGSADMIKGFMSKDSVKQMAAQGLPDHPVKIGDSWPFKFETSSPAMGGGMVVDMTYTFTGWEQRGDHKCAVLAFSGDIYTKAGDDGATPAMVSLDDGKTTGEMLFDPALGMAVENSAIQSFTMKVNVQGKSMSTKMTQDIAVKLMGVTDIPQ
jgi:hypothetical protein